MNIIFNIITENDSRRKMVKKKNYLGSKSSLREGNQRSHGISAHYTLTFTHTHFCENKNATIENEKMRNKWNSRKRTPVFRDDSHNNTQTNNV